MTIFREEEAVIDYLYTSKMINNHQKKSIKGMIDKNNYSVRKYISNTKMFEEFIGHFGCGVECCGPKINYRLQ